MYIEVKGILKKFGTTVKVHVPSNDKPKYVGGVKVKTSAQDTIKEHFEPVIPNSSQNAMMAQFVSGGALVEADLIWLSSTDQYYPINTLVEVPSQRGTFRVINYSAFPDQSDLVVYELKNDNKHSQGGGNDE